MQSDQSQILQTRSYIPAQYYENKEYLVKYYVLNPETGKLHRKIIKCNRIKNKTQREKWAKDIIREINIKLANGWNPFIEQSAAKSYTKLTAAMDIFISHKNKELRKDTLRSYNNYVKFLKYWLESRNKRDYFVVSFSRHDAIDCLQYVYIEKNVRNRTYNNYLKFFRALWNWFVEYEYCTTNVFKKLSTKKKEPKKRILIPAEVRASIKDHLETNEESGYLLACLLCYNCLIRPKEMSFLKIENFHLDKQYIHVPGDIAKNGKDRFITIPDHLAPYLKKVVNSDFANYVFSTNFYPGKIQKPSKNFDKRWAKLRNQIGLPMEMQFYSFRDTGITELIQSGIPVNVVRDHADHSSLAMTDIYSKHYNPEVSIQIKTMSPKF